MYPVLDGCLCFVFGIKGGLGLEMDFMIFDAIGSFNGDACRCFGLLESEGNMNGCGVLS